MFLGVVFSLGSLSPQASAAPRARLVEAHVSVPFDPGAPIRLSPMTSGQAQDPLYRDLGNRLAEELRKNGFNVVGPEQDTRVVVLYEYVARNIPVGRQFVFPVNDSSYRALVVTAIDSSQQEPVRVIWQTVVDSTGISANPREVVPGLIAAAGRHLGRNETPKGLNDARWCAGGYTPVGSHISVSCPARPEPPPSSGAPALLGATVSR